MKLFVATFNDEDGTEFVGIFTTKEKAEDAIREAKANRRNFYQYDDVMEFELDKDVMNVPTDS